jgi:hypothetical protein
MHVDRDSPLGDLTEFLPPRPPKSPPQHRQQH